VRTPFGWAIFHTGNDRGSANYTIAWPEARAAVVIMGNSNRLEAIAQDVVELLSGDRSSPFEFLGYDRWDDPRQLWLTTLAGEGAAAGRRYWESLGPEREEWGLDDEEAFARGAEALAHFRGIEESLELHRWRRSLFPESADAVRDQVRALVDAGKVAEAVAELDGVPDPLAEELAWFEAWVRAVANPVEVPTERLESYAGEYEVRRFELRGDQLFYGRDATPAEDFDPLVGMSEDTFVMPDVDFFRLRFETDESGRATRVVGVYEDGREDSNPRTADPAD
jgi:hypothetical protein